MNNEQPVAKYYDKLAPIYDQATAQPGVWTPPEFVAKEIAKREIGSPIFIVGIGTGKDIQGKLCGLQAEIEGLDISEKMVEICRTKFPNVSVYCSDFMTFTQFQRKEYQLIICSGTLEFISDFEGFFMKSAKLLVKNGMLIVTYEPLIHSHKLQAEACAKTVTNRESQFHVDDFFTFRRTLMQFQNAIGKAGLGIVEFFEFVAYRKAETDIIYHLAVLKK